MQNATVRNHTKPVKHKHRSFQGNSQLKQVINAQTGEVLNRTGSGYIGSRDGTFYTDATGGIINTRTGEFSPAN